MVPNYQLIPYCDHAKAIYGDCMRTCVASLLNLEPEDVPHFLHDNSDEWLPRLNAWLAPRKLAYLVFGVGEASLWVDIMKRAGQDLFHLITVESATPGVLHQIIGRNGKPYWCPILGNVQGRNYEMLEFGFLVITSL